MCPYPPLLAAKSFKLGFELVLQKNWGETEKSKYHEKEHGLYCYGVHSRGQLLEGCPGLEKFDSMLTKVKII